MHCLQCKAKAVPSEVIDGIQIYTCADGHRTGQATVPMIEWSEKYKRQAALGIFDLEDAA